MFDFIQVVVFFGFIVIIAPILGKYIAHVYQNQPVLLSPALGWLENVSYRVSNIDPKQSMSWQEYAKAVFIFNGLGFAFLFLLLILQGWLPLNPQNFPSIHPVLAFNIAISFVTNADWQSYGGESTLSYLSQMLGLTVQNFLSAATGIAVLGILIRGIMGKAASTLGNFWVDLVRITVYLLLPLAIVIAIIISTQGVIQSLSPYVEITTLENGKQTIPLGPVASQTAIMQLGTNGGGFFNANSAHPFENPTPLTNFIEMLSIVLIPAALPLAYGYMIGSTKHGWLLFLVMLFMCLFGLVAAGLSEYFLNSKTLPYMEGKETRLGVMNSILWSVSTTATGNGSVNAMLDSLTPLAGGVAMFNIMLGELILGGVGTGHCTMIIFVLLTVFISGLMVGRTPEYLGKKIEKKEMQWVMVAVLAPNILILFGAGASVIIPAATSSVSNHGPHGFSEILYAFSSAAGNNGSSFAGLNTNTNYYNMILGIVMGLARLSILLPAIAIAGLLVNKKISPPSIGTFSTNTLLFAVLLIGVIVIVGGLTFFPALSLGPIAEHYLMLDGKVF